MSENFSFHSFCAHYKRFILLFTHRCQQIHLKHFFFFFTDYSKQRENEDVFEMIPLLPSLPTDQRENSKTFVCINIFILQQLHSVFFFTKNNSNLHNYYN